MSEPDLRLQLAQGRTAQFDWLPGNAAPQHIAPTLAAMANTYDGGRLLVGVGEAVTHTVEAIDRVLQAALMLMPPLIIPLPRISRLEDQPVLIVEIPSGMPHVYALDGRYLAREGASNLPMHPHNLRRLLMQRGEISFEAEAVNGQLDWGSVRAYAAKVGQAHESDAALQTFLIKRGCMVETPDGVRPTHAGLLLFGRDVQSHLRGAEITAVRFAGETMGDTFDRQDIRGTLPEQIRRAETFLRDHLRKAMALQATMERAERFEYPLEAVRELVVNAVAHRDYSIQGDGIRLFLFKDRMEITSPGLLPGPVTVSNIADERFSRNPVIVQVLADMGFIERLGYGVDRVIELMRHHGLRAPEFCETRGGVRVVLFNLMGTPPLSSPVEATIDSTTPAVSAAEPAPAQSSEGSHLLGVSAEAVRQLLEPYREITLNPRQETALIYLHQAGNTRITNSELQRLYPEVHAETIRRDLSDLVTKQLLVKMGQKRGSYYVLKVDD